MIVISDQPGVIDARGTMYPCYAELVVGPNGTKVVHDIAVHEYSTLYGFCLDEATVSCLGDKYDLKRNDYFCIPRQTERVIVATYGRVFLVHRYGFQGYHTLGRAETQGRLSYIDGCSDSLLVYPPRLGDPSLNLLYFPPKVDQTFHTHPSIRIGVVAEGRGIADCGDEVKHLLSPGTMFMLEEQELHRFRTLGKSMRIVAFHPDGDWGPTDENHTMLNRTYIKK